MRAPGGRMLVQFGAARRALLLGAISVLFTLVALVLGPAPLTASSALYTVADLGALDCCPGSIARAINIHGEVVGEVQTLTDPQLTYPFIYENGQMRMIGALQGSGVGINDAGQATGWVWTP